MTKWLALALGALLAIGGSVSIWNGLDIIQSERGWASVIAGAVSLAGGVVTSALFLVIRELQALRASLSMVLESEPAPAPLPIEPPARPVAVHPLAPLVDQAPPVAPPVEVAPQVVEAAPEPAAPAPRETTAPESFSFDQVFPPVPVEPPPAPPARERFRFRASDAAIGIAAGAAALGAFGRSRATDAVPAPPAQPEAAPQETVPAPEPHRQFEVQEETSVRVEVEAFTVSDAELEETAAALRGAVPMPAAPELEAAHEEQHEEPQPEEPVEAPSPEASGEQPQGEPVAEEPPAAEVDESVVSPGYAWLKRALAREEGQKSPALEWLRSRPPTSLLIDPLAPPQEAAHEEAHEEAPAEAEAPSREAEPEEEQSAAPVETQVEPEAAHEAAQDEAQHEPAPAEPTVVGRYSSGGSEYTLYSDGSIDAQTEQGLFRFESMNELRAYIEAQNNQS